MMLAIAPESELERRLLDDPRLRAGLEWGTPRFGHPEGRVGDHVAAMLAEIGDNDVLRSDLRLLALLHDSFKAEVRPRQPWSPENDHATIARRFAERYISDERLLITLELHDEPYWVWRTDAGPERALRGVLERLPDTELFARFVELDGATEGKDLTFLWWFRRELAIRGQLPAQTRVGRSAGTRDVVYVKSFATQPEQQPAIAQAANDLVVEQRSKLHGEGEVLTSDDGLRVWLLWRWHGSRGELIARDAAFVQDALAAHPVFAEAQPVEARIFQTVAGG